MNRICVLAIVLTLAAVTGCGQKAYTRTTAVTPAPVESGPLPRSASPCRSKHAAASAKHKTPSIKTDCRPTPAARAGSRTK